MLNETTEAMNEVAIKDNSNFYENSDGMKTFENLDEDPALQEDETEEKESSKEDKKESKKGEKEEVDEELKLLNDSDGTEEKDKKKEDKKEKEEKEDKEEEDKKEDKKEEEEKKPVEEENTKKTKKLKVKVGEELFSLEPNATIRHKVDGKMEDIPVQELLSNYNGKVAYDRRFGELGEKNKEVEAKSRQVEEAKGLLKQKIEPILEVIKDETRDPYEAVMHIVDMVGGDPYNIFRRSLESRLGELENLLDMSEVERKAYFLEKQNEFLLQSAKKRNESYESEQKLNQYVAQVDQIRQSFGVSEEQFVEALDELVSLGFDEKEVTDEFAAEWAALKPYKEEVETLIEPYLDEIEDSEYGNIVSTLSRNLRGGKTTKDHIVKYLEEAYSVPTELKELNTRIQKPGPKPASDQRTSNEQERLATFDDLLD